MMYDLRSKKTVILNRGEGMVLQLLLRRDDDRYTALWVFDIDAERRFVAHLVVRLTRDEAQRVADADPYTVGFLEPVRPILRDRDADVLVANFEGEAIGSFPVHVPAEGAEQEFVAMLDRTASMVFEVGVARGADADPAAAEVDPEAAEVLNSARHLQGV
ncbi:hypothetical protein [Isoptericola sp. NPDC056605]|uniref:hypothetical protein n=1 Tax=Isoptericola sp. NPDC056605 TaxID=3345876 RepID=UPI00368083B4